MLRTDAQEAYERREADFGTGPAASRCCASSSGACCCRSWTASGASTSYEMDYLQEGIGLRAMGQRDPLVEYQREGFDMFTAMMDAIKEESVGFLFNVEVQVEESRQEE